MEIISPEKWSVKTEMTEQERVKTQLAIKEEAERICRRRKDKAADLENQVKDLSVKKAQIESIINSIKESLCVESDSQKKSKIEKLCNDLNDLVRDYQLKLKKLQDRFANQKIRVLSFGSKSQGKSSFTSAYTNLSNAVIGVKPNGNNDKTGTTSVIIHKKGVPADSPEIYVIFKKPKIILDTVNYCFAKLGMNYRFSNWAELFKILENKKSADGSISVNNEKQKIHNEIGGFRQDPHNPIAGFGSIVETLKWIFKPISDFSDVNSGNDEYFDIKKGKKINLADLPQYNDMTNNTLQSFTSVAEIHIYVDLEHSGMFENIEICDTKGISIEAGGGEWEKELYGIIGQSDAVFSIQATGVATIGQSDTKFYEDLNKEAASNPETLKDLNLKHFALINPWEGTNEIVSENDGVVGHLNKSSIVNTVYIGPLKDGVVYDGNKCVLQDFVDYVIHDMMKKIVITTNQTDENLLKERETFEAKIRNKKEELVRELFTYDTFSPRNEDEIIRDSIGKWILEVGIPEVENSIISVAKESNVPLTFLENKKERKDEVNHINQPSSEYDDFDVVNTPKHENEIGMTHDYAPLEQITYKISDIEEQKVKEGIFKIITGKEEFPTSLKGKNNNEIVKQSISVLFEQIKTEIGKEKYLYRSNIKGSYTNIGAYIDDASDLISRRIIDNVNRTFAPDEEMPGSQSFKDTLFSSIWNVLKLDILYKSFESKILKKVDKKSKIDNKRLEHWSIPYNLSASIPASAPILPPPSYVILKHYFDNQNDTPDINSYNEVAVKEQELVKAIQEAYLVYDIPERYKLKRSEEFKWKTDLCQHLWADVEDSARFSEELIELYKYVCPNELVNKLTSAGIIDKKIKDECEDENRKMELKKRYHDLSRFSI